MNQTNPNDDLYRAPESQLTNDAEMTPVPRIFSRKRYFASLLLVWIVIPLVASFIAVSTGIDEGGLSSYAENGTSGFHLDSLYVWYISLPMFLWFTFQRVKDTGLSGWFTLLFMLPLINLIIWFWPPQKQFTN